MKFFAKELLVDQHGKAVNFRLHSIGFPHMRALHLAWISFMVAFMSWYAIPPLIDYIAEELEIPAAEVYDSNVVAVSMTIAARLIVGPMCERFGPRRVMASLLIMGSIPCAMTGLIKNGGGLIALRCVIGILGATFVPCQFWATQMFAPSVLGTANAISAGWGNMGAGITYLLMPAFYNGILKHTTSAIAWRSVFVIPAGICITVAFCVLLFATDTPNGDWIELKRQEKSSNGQATIDAATMDKMEKASSEHTDDTADQQSLTNVKKNETFIETMIGFGRTLIKPGVLIMVVHYACSFGVELAIDNVIGQVFKQNFSLDPSVAAYIGSIFGLLNLFSRLCGGLFSDFVAKRHSLPGRIFAHMLILSLEGAFLIGFSFGLDISMAVTIVLMIFFSFFVQAACGTTFAIVPFVDPLNNGKVMGIVGAGGNIGGLVFNIMFKEFHGDFHTSFLCLGIISLGAGVLGCSVLRVQGKTVWKMFSKLNI